MTLRAAIEAGDVAALRAMLVDNPSNANALIEWGDRGEIVTHPLHFTCDKLFDGTLPRGAGAPLARALIAAGADPNFRGGDPLNAATSLGATEIADVLLDAGARVDLPGSFGEMPIHWAANIGALHTVCRLLDRGAAVDVRDEKWSATPLGWALHGWDDPPPRGEHGQHHEVVRVLIAAGASVEPGWLETALAHGRDDVVRALNG